jgi:hypothetical protein
MANKYAIDYKVTLKVVSTDLRTAKLKAENYIEHLPPSYDFGFGHYQKIGYS